MNERHFQPEAFEFEEETFADESEFGEHEAALGESAFGGFSGELGDEGVFELEEEAGTPYVHCVQGSLNRLLGLQLAVDGVEGRRVEIFFPSTPGPVRPLPPDHSGCGVPLKVKRGEVNLEEEIQQRRRVAQAGAKAQPRLSLFQNSSTRPHPNHFECQATRWAGRIAAVANPIATDCPRRVGATPYDTGADIILSIENARTCTSSAVNAVRILSHSGSHGVFGTLSSGSVGLYRDGDDADSRRDGARAIADIPITPFSDNIVIARHGCNAAAGDDGFARALFEHHTASVKNPIVFGHSDIRTAGAQAATTAGANF